MNLRKEDCPTEYMKIRKQLLNLVFKAGPTPVRLASCRELGKRFGVTHMTVARVMKDLDTDGYLEKMSILFGGSNFLKRNLYTGGSYVF